MAADSQRLPGAFSPDVRRLIAAAREGDRDALGRLVESCRGYLLTMANRRVDPQLRAKLAASDLVQETLLAAQQNIHQFRGESEPELLAWLKQILFHHLSDARRSWSDAEKRQLARERNLDGDSRTGKVAVELADNVPTPGTGAVMREQAEALRQAIERLPEHFREAIRLRSWERLPFEEIGRRMDRTPEAARKLWSRAVERLRGELGSDNETA